MSSNFVLELFSNFRVAAIELVKEADGGTPRPRPRHFDEA